MKINTEASCLFDELYFKSEARKFHRRKISETLSRIKTWFNKELRSNEVLPKEFSEILQSHNYQPLSQNLSYEVLKMNCLWSKAL
jgi:hypothetical protein